MTKHALAEQHMVSVSGEAPKKPPRLKASHVDRRAASEASTAGHNVEAVSVDTLGKGKSKKRLQFHSPLLTTSTRAQYYSESAEATRTTHDAVSETVKDGCRLVEMHAKNRNRSIKKETSTIPTGGDSVIVSTATPVFPARPTSTSTPSAIKNACALTARKATAAAPKTTTTAPAPAPGTTTATDVCEIKVGEGVDEGGVQIRLARGCTSLMYACQHGDIAEVLAQLRSRVSS